MNELDYKQMYEKSQEMLNATFEMQNEFFNTLSELNQMAPYSKIINEKIMEARMCDQLNYYKIVVLLFRQAKLICEKYGWDEELKIEETECNE